MLLVVLALAVRGSIPMGYMLDAVAMQSGSLRLALCSFGTPLPGSQRSPAAAAPHQDHPAPIQTAGDGASRHAGHDAVLEAPLSHPDHGDDAHEQACPFGLVMAQGLATPPVDDVLALALPSLARTVLPGLAPETLPPLPPLGPPLGSRAPPPILG
jgi:hypothetical protein